MTVEQIVNMTAEEYKAASFDEQHEATMEMLERFRFQKEWLEKHQYMDKRNWEYRQHKKFMLEDREKLCSWLNAIGFETLPYTE